jgi:cyclic beta-1,2-glucan synthetase
MRRFKTPNSRVPEVHFLYNGRYQVMVTNSGGGYSRWRDLMLTRWREDSTSDSWGTFVYLRDTVTGEFWSTGYQPTLHSFDRYEVIFSEGLAEFKQQRDELEIQTTICVSGEHDVELRRVTLINRSSHPRSLEFTTYAEVVLAHPAADAAHPAFSNLFVQTEFDPRDQALLCKRRPRSEGENPPWLLHAMISQEESDLSYETDRARFIGRNGTAARPAAMQAASPLSMTTGSVLDPIVSLRRTFALAPASSLDIDLMFCTAETRESALAVLKSYRQSQLTDQAFDTARNATPSQDFNSVELDHYQQLASALVYADPSRRAAPEIMLQNRLGQSRLWTYGISGDIPIALARLRESADLGLAKELAQASSYWHSKGFAADVVILAENPLSASSSLDQEFAHLAAQGVKILRANQIPKEDIVLLQAAARIVLPDRVSGSWFRVPSSERDPGETVLVPAERSTISSKSELDPLQSLELGTRKPEPETLSFYNGLGGFTPDGREYLIHLQPGQTTPAPWVNVLANPNFGTVISESGSSYTWAENSHEFRLTPWNNDPITDSSGEAFYIRDDESGDFWSPTPWPVRGATPYLIRHGFGYSVFEHSENGITSELTIYVAIDAPLKIAILKLKNVSGRPRKISVAGYWEWVLGDSRQKYSLHVLTETNAGALFARNLYNSDFPGWTAFVDVSESEHTWTADRTEFLGRNGTASNPAALKGIRLSGRTGIGLDPCAAIQVKFNLADGQERENSFRLGAGPSLAHAEQVIQRFREHGADKSALEAVKKYWQQTIECVQVETPDPSVNFLVNGWLLYQVLCCRFWGRTGFYQSGGAFGFRDQLQDVMALVHAEPGLIREHLLRAAAHQFREGDVLHWWHPPAGRGVRTHVSDDYLWLPYVAYRYVSALGDEAVLDEEISFLEGRPVSPDEESYYDLPQRSQETGTLYEHCVRAIKNGLRFGEHGLPLMGTGDWNDGMNLVGEKGRGESVWLAFFLYDVLVRFAELARKRNDGAFADHCLGQAKQLQTNIEAHAWDGQWYRRAYFDNGEPLGSHLNQECRIDAISQSWSVISGAANAERAAKAIHAAEEHLVHPEAKLIQLLDPPFDRSVPHPGYIRGYVPGVRENGGQYTHAAIWTTMAFALLGEVDRAWDLVALLSPIRHAITPEQVNTYKVEPYVIAADVYAVAPHTGRGGWTWYTGSAGWMYRLLTETLLGLNLESNQLRLAPRLPRSWAGYKVDYRYQETTYHITFSRREHEAAKALRVSLDGNNLDGAAIPLLNDKREHQVEVVLAE